tara:strand:- start:327 stop:674 length:348 start_codon:yes stop_codon:yes gene_type:complete
MKNKRQYRDSERFTFIGYVGIILISVAILLGVGEYTGFNDEMAEKIKNDPRPTNPLYNYMHPNMWVDTIIELNPEDFTDIDSIEEYDKQQMNRLDSVNKESKDWTGTTQGDTIWE